MASIESEAEAGSPMKNVDKRILWAFGVLVVIGTVAAYVYEFQRPTLSDAENRSFVVLLALLTIPTFGLAAVIDFQSHTRVTRPMVVSWIGVAISWAFLLIIELFDTTRGTSMPEGLVRVMAVVPAVGVVIMRFVLHRRARGSSDGVH